MLRTMSNEPGPTVSDPMRPGDPRPDVTAGRQLILLDGGEATVWSLSPRTRAIGKRGVAEARAILARSSRAGSRAPLDVPDEAVVASERKAG
jgi:hypothetical protein